MEKHDKIFIYNDISFNFQGKCTSIINDKEEKIEEIRARSFNIFLTIHGDILGYFTFANFEEATKFYNQVKGKFHLEGENDEYYFNIKDVVIHSYENQEQKQTLNFIATDLILNKKESINEITNLEIEYGLINVFELNYKELEEIKFIRNSREESSFPIVRNKKGFSFMSSIGKLTIDNYKNIFANSETMRNSRISLITSFINIQISNKNQNLTDITETTKEVVEDFLKITSFVQSSKHDWIFMIIKNSLDIHHIKIRRIRKENPFYLPVDISITDNLYYKLWQNFSKEIDNLCNFTMALEWYLHAISLEEIDMKFVSASTALECILAKFFANNSNGLKTTVFTSGEFKKFKKEVKPVIENILINMGKVKTKDQIFKQIDEKLMEFNRITYAKKIEFMLRKLKIDYSDFNDNNIIDNLVNIRNKIVHRGEISNMDNNQLKDVSDKFYIFITLLSRIFLRILNYQGKYYDIYHKTVKQI